MKKNQFRKPYRVKRKVPFYKNRVLVLGFLFSVFSAGVFYLIFLCPIAQIKNIKISGCEKVAIQSLSEQIEKAILGKIGFLNTKSILLANSGEIARGILENFPQIEKAEIKKDFSGGLSVSISERKPSAVFSKDGEYFLMDSTGVIFERIDEAPQNMAIVSNGISTSSAPTKGDQAVPGDIVSWILKLETSMKAGFNLAIEEVNLVSEQRLNIKTSEGWQAYFNLKGDMAWQITELETVLKEKILPAKRKNLEYIDLRFDRIFIYPEIN
jgi:hypothetical protein